jgi:hypothetical protein
MVQGGGDMKESIKIAAGLAFIAAAMFFVLSISGAEAAYWVDSCVNETHMTTSLDLNNKVDNSTIISLNQPPIYCDNGCNPTTGKCNVIPVIYYKGLGTAFLIIVIYIAWAIMKTQPKESEGI